MNGSPPYPYDERPEVLPLVPAGAQRILDVGCGRGGFGAALRRAAASRTLWGVEQSAELCQEAAPHYDRCLVGSYPDALASADADRPSFDCIVFNDVLEHMVDPWDALRSTQDFLAPGGSVVASLPNVRNAQTVVDLVVRGRWTYVEMGVLDRTHLRFFTKRTMRALFEDVGYEVEVMAGIHPIGERRGRTYRVLPTVLREFAYRGFVLRARPA